MNSYQRGFIEKCAEYGVDPRYLIKRSEEQRLRYRKRGLFGIPSGYVTQEDINKMSPKEYRKFGRKSVYGSRTKDRMKSNDKELRSLYWSRAKDSIKSFLKGLIDYPSQLLEDRKYDKLNDQTPEMY